LAAFILLGYNAFALSSLFSPPLVGRSKETRLASQNWLKFMNKIALNVKESIDDFDLSPIASRFTPDLEEVKKQSPYSEPELIEFEEEIEIKLPVLTGIIQVLDAQGKQRSFALIEGKRLMEKDRVIGFTLLKIKNEGVLVSKEGKTWFIPSPKIHFSLDQGM